MERQLLPLLRQRVALAAADEARALPEAQARAASSSP